MNYASTPKSRSLPPDWLAPEFAPRALASSASSASRLNCETRPREKGITARKMQNCTLNTRSTMPAGTYVHEAAGQMGPEIE